MLRIVIIVLIMVPLSGCVTTYRVASDFEKGVDFRSYKTFKIVDHKDDFPDGANPINQQRINRAVNREMIRLGYSLSENPDLLVSCFVKEKNIRVTDIYRTHYSRWSYGQYIRVREYRSGTLILDMIDNNTDMVIWHSKTSGKIINDMKSVEENINKAVSAIFDQYIKDLNAKKGYALN